MKQRIKVILADDDPILSAILPRQLNSAEFEIIAFASGKELLNSLESAEADVVLLDVNLPDASGLEILPQIREAEDAPEVIMLTADTTLKTGLESMRLGAYDYVTKPATPEHIAAILRKASEKHSLVRQNARLRAAVRQQTSETIIEPAHKSPVMRQVFQQAGRVAKIDTTVLITGESGTGKDVLARWIHSQSPRFDSPIVSINCGALPENLFESEFFGHEKGSFTGASTQKIGLVEAADGSTLFLDEIGEMPLSIQVKLLHFLENGTFRRVGANRERKADVRLIAATNRPMEEDVQNKKFRADLYYRLNVVSFHLPALRERPEDIAELIELFLEKLRQRFSRPLLRLSPEAQEKLETYEWRGNIRELRNTLERAAVLSPSDEITEIHGLAKTSESSPEKPPTASSIAPLPLAEIEKQHILRVLSEVGGKREKAAAILGITARTLYRKLNEYGNH